MMCRPGASEGESGPLLLCDCEIDGRGGDGSPSRHPPDGYGSRHTVASKDHERTTASPADDEGGARRDGWAVVAFGQAIALALSCANAASSALENDHRIRVPAFQTGLVYSILSLHLVYLFWRHRTKQDGGGGGDREKTVLVLSCDEVEVGPEDTEHPSKKGSDGKSSDTEMETPSHYTFPFTSLPLRTPWHVYLLLAALDVEANYLAMLSFQHTSLSSSMLMTSLSVLSTVFLRRLIFRGARYDRRRTLGTLTCLAGGCLWLREEFRRGDGVHQTTENEGGHALYGDLLALSAACIYGLNDVLAEFFVKANNDGAEYLGMVGFFGSLISLVVQAPLLERDRVSELIASLSGNFDGDRAHSMSEPILLLLCFVVMLCFFYVMVMKFLSAYDATVLNLSLQSCPLWAVILTALQKSGTGSSGREAIPPAVFFVSLTMVIAGMILYEMGADDANHDRGK